MGKFLKRELEAFAREAHNKILEANKVSDDLIEATAKDKYSDLIEKYDQVRDLHKEYQEAHKELDELYKKYDIRYYYTTKYTQGIPQRILNHIKEELISKTPTISEIEDSLILASADSSLSEALSKVLEKYGV